MTNYKYKWKHDDSERPSQPLIFIKKSRSIGMSELLFPTNPLPLMKPRSPGLSTIAFANVVRNRELNRSLNSLPFTTKPPNNAIKSLSTVND